MTACRTSLRLALGALASIAAAFAIGIGNAPVRANHGPFTLSAAIYRIPYADGTIVTANNDHHNHPSVFNRVDLGGGDGSTIVAAASGIIRGIADHHGNSSGRGDGLAADGVTPQDDNLEHSCSDDEDDDGNAIPDSTVKGLCSQHNNYVWIEHANGEWTKYTHFATGSVSLPPPAGNGWQEGQTILVGQALGTQSDVGSAGGSHLHFEVAAIPASAPSPPFSDLGGFVNSSWNVVTRVCFADGDDNGDSLYTDGESYTAGPCVNTAPAANAGGPYQVNEGSAVVLDGSNSSDPHNAILTYAWSPGTNLDDPSSATPTYNGVDDGVENITLTVSDLGGDVTAATALTDDDAATVTVLNVPPSVTAIGDSISEGGVAIVRATFTDPGLNDTHTATILWGDGSPGQIVSVAALAAGVAHGYGDNGSYSVTVTVTDDDGGMGADAVMVLVANVAPEVSFDPTGAIAFPGGEFMVVQAGGALPGAAEGTDAGSDDLTFVWSIGEENVYYNNGTDADPFPSPFGTFPFHASDSIDAVYASPGVQQLTVTVADDDGGSDNDGGNVIVTGTAENTEGSGWWRHQYSGDGSAHISSTTAAGYLAIVNSVSGVFSEAVSAAVDEEVVAILSPHAGDLRARARAELMVSWLQFASGAVAWDATVPLAGGGTVTFLDLMFQAETTLLDATATDSELSAVEQLLMRVRHAS